MSTAAVSPGFICKLKDRKEVAEGTMAFRFEKPSGCTFKAGQYLDMTVLDPSEMDSEGNLRSFSIASAPHEVTLMVATRMRYGVQTHVEDNAVWDRSEDRRAVRGFDSSERFNASGRIPRWWDWHHAVSKYCPVGSEGQVAASYCPFLFQQAARRCSVPRRASELGRRQSELQVSCQHD